MKACKNFVPFNNLFLKAHSVVFALVKSENKFNGWEQWKKISSCKRKFQKKVW